MKAPIKQSGNPDWTRAMQELRRSSASAKQVNKTKYTRKQKHRTEY